MKKHYRRIAVVGLGYVGLPLAVAFANDEEIVSFDINEKRIQTLKDGYDWTNEVTKEDLKKAKLLLTSNPEDLKKADFFIVAVPTPINDAKIPNLRLLESASTIVGKNMPKNSIVVYESTVYPGVTEDFCVPILEKESGFKCGKDFKVGYSPERINPGDKEHTFKKILKVVSAMDKESLDIIAEVYESVVEPGVFKASSIKVAEAAKVIENTQRDINIALMNELKRIFDKMNISIKDVLEASGTKWNFLKFTPGLVGGHCIGVDPYYLAYEAKRLGHNPEIIIAGRRINDDMPYYEAYNIIKYMSSKDINPHDAKVLILGATFKPNVPDLRNSKIKNVCEELASFGCKISICDPMFEPKKDIFGYENLDLEYIDCNDFDLIVYAVNHKKFESKLPSFKEDCCFYALFN